MNGPKSYEAWYAEDFIDVLLESNGEELDPESMYAEYVKQFEPARRYVVRRLTPLECCRLQGFPDNWCEGVPGSDSAQYKMWGNGMALPNAFHVMRGIAKLVASERSNQ